MYRSYDNVIVNTNANWALYNPILICNVVAVSSDGGFKVGDGVNRWNDLPFNSGSALGSKSIQSGSPVNHDIIEFNATDDEWQYINRGQLIPHSEIIADTNVYPTMAVIIETDDSTGIPTGRIKFGDGVTRLDNIPWGGGIHICGEFATGVTGKSIVWSGYEWVNKTVYTEDDFAFPTNPNGLRYLRDDKSFATIPTIHGPSSSTSDNIVTFDGTDGLHYKDSGISINNLVTNSGTSFSTFQINIGVGPKLVNSSGDLKVYKNDGVTLANVTSSISYASYGIFASVNIGSFPSESTSVNLTSDGTFLYVDGGKLIDANHDGHGSGLDADTVDGYQADQFATVGDLTTYATQDDVIVYSIVFGG